MTKTDLLTLSGVVLLIIASMGAIYYGSSYNSAPAEVKSAPTASAAKNRQQNPEPAAATDKKEFKVVKSAESKDKTPEVQPQAAAPAPKAAAAGPAAPAPQQPKTVTPPPEENPAF